MSLNSKSIEWLINQIGDVCCNCKWKGAAWYSHYRDLFEYQCKGLGRTNSVNGKGIIARCGNYEPK